MITEEGTVSDYDNVGSTSKQQQQSYQDTSYEQTRQQSPTYEDEYADYTEQ